MSNRMLPPIGEGEKTLTWRGPHECPRCHRTVAVGIMSLAATCECGAYFADVIDGGGWFESQADYLAGSNAIKSRTEVAENG